MTFRVTATEMVTVAEVALKPGDAVWADFRPPPFRQSGKYSGKRGMVTLHAVGVNENRSNVVQW